MERTIPVEAWRALAKVLDVEEAALSPVAAVESAGDGFLSPPSELPKVIFEGHAFHRRNQVSGRSRPALTQAILLGAAATLLSAGVMAAQQPGVSLEAHKLELENQKLQLEIERLKERSAPWWLSSFLGVAVGVGTALGGVFVAKRNRLGDLDQSVHDERLKTYPALVQAAERLAIYFPPHNPPGQPLGPQECGEMGRAMSQWYFREGGLLLSEDSRPAYFLLARALTRASVAHRISAPLIPRDADAISAEKIERYRVELGFPKVPNVEYVEQWIFGRAAPEAAFAARFPDYVLLQWLSSTLRATLSEDLRSRRRPAR